MTFEHTSLWGVLLTSLLAILYAGFLVRQVLHHDQGTPKMQAIADVIRTGANVYLQRQFRVILIVIGLLAVGLYFSAALAGQRVSICLGRAAAFLLGSFSSATVGYIGMNIAVQGNVRVAAAARTSFTDALRIGYQAGTVTGMLTTGLGLLGPTIILLVYGRSAPEVLLGLGFGGTLLALFMRVGGGIYTKAADIGADLVGKVEVGIPEDDPRNAAVIADLVGDNVGDCAGMAADIFESYGVTIVSVMILGLTLQPPDLKWIVFPLIALAIGIMSSLLGGYVMSLWSTRSDAFKAMDLSYSLSAFLSAICFLLLAHFYIHDLRAFWATAVGILLAIGFNKYTAYFTLPEKRPVRELAGASRTGAATSILSGFSLGSESAACGILLVAMAIFCSMLIFRSAGITHVLYGVALCGIGMLSQTGNYVSMDAFGPIADNASGIGEMAGLEPKAREIMAALDAAGNTTKAITKGIAAASAILAAVSLFGSFVETAGLQTEGLNIASPSVFIGALIGGSMPFVFSALTIRAVGRAASLVMDEVRRQFRIPGLMEGKVKPDYDRVIAICTQAAQQELVSLALLAILVPILVGFLLGVGVLGGLLAGGILTGALLAVFMINAGGAWDNAKKFIEDGHHGGKYSEPHRASVIGDTVGDPLKDTAGPSLDIMIKVMNLVALLIAPLVKAHERWTPLGLTVMAGTLLLVLFAIWHSKKDAYSLVEIEEDDPVTEP
ncbi:MAG: sodium-translocating pyrophosphatase [Chloroflexi bacterium]|nr:sodium-translocating pyrophosphatase [Chloroflexota bacterium]